MMIGHLRPWLALLLGGVTLAPLQPARAADGEPPADCSTYAVDVSRERAAMLSLDPAQALVADASAPPMLVSDRPYRLRLAAQQGFPFAVPPERRQLDEGAYAGLARFTVSTTGRWRVSLDAASWIDVVDAAGTRVAACHFEGRHGCVGLRKWVEFPLVAGVEYTLQLSGGNDAAITILVSGASHRMP